MPKYLLILIFLCLPLTVFAEEPIFGAADGVSPAGLAAVSALGDGFSFREAIKTLGTDGDFSFLSGLWRGLIHFIFGQAAVSLRIPFSIAAAAILCSLFGGLSEENGVGEAGFFVSYALLCGLSASACVEAAALCRQAAEDMSTFINAALPSLAVLSFSTGSGIGAVTPAALSAASAASLLLTKVGIPALYLSLALSLIGNLSTASPLVPLSATIRKAALWLVCGSMTLFSAFLSISGYAAGSMGTAAARGVKYAVSSLVPVLGGILSESAEAVRYSALAIKGAAGGAGLLFLLLLCLSPILRTMLHALGYRLAAAFSAPAIDKRLCTALGQMADLLSALAAMTAAVGALFILSIGLLARMGGGVG